MEDSKIQRSLEHYFLPRHEYEKDKNDLFAHFNKRLDANRDKIEEVDDRHTQKFYELQRSLDDYSHSVKVLNSSVQSLDATMKTMTENITATMDDVRTVSSRVEVTEKNITQSQLLKEERKSEFLKFASIIVSGLMGAGGLISWLGPLLFSGSK